jgi:hypothetical protein
MVGSSMRSFRISGAVLEIAGSDRVEQRRAAAASRKVIGVR